MGVRRPKVAHLVPLAGAAAGIGADAIRTATSRPSASASRRHGGSGRRLPSPPSWGAPTYRRRRAGAPARDPGHDGGCGDEDDHDAHDGRTPRWRALGPRRRPESEVG